MLKVAALLVAANLLLILALQSRSLHWSPDAKAAQQAVTDLAEALAQYRQRFGRLPGDLNRDGEIDAAESGSTEVTAKIAGKTVTLRAVARRASAVPGFAVHVRNVIELRGLPCRVAEELDAKTDDGNFSTGNTRANVPSCAVGGVNDPVPVLAVALPP